MKNLFYDKANNSAKFWLSIEINNSLQVIFVRSYSLDVRLWFFEAIVWRFSRTKPYYSIEQVDMF